MSEKKYLSDGRKVVVIGAINKTEFIVQEIFVTNDGSEIPSGENFTAKTLLDEPAKSHKEVQAEKVEARLEQLKQKESTLSKEISNLEQKILAHSTLLQSNEKFLELFEGTDTTLLADIVTGNVKYVMGHPNGYDTFKVQTFEDAVYKYEKSYHGDVYSFESLKMLSVMCAKGSRYPSDRRFYTCISGYEDGSGSSKEVVCFNSEDAVKKELEKRMYKKLEVLSEGNSRKTLSSKEIKELEEWIVVPEHIKQASKEEDLRNAKEYYKNRIKEAKEYYTKATGEII